jgi:hypothetical protein
MFRPVQNTTDSALYADDFKDIQRDIKISR